MFNLLAGAFMSVAGLFGGLFGHHMMPPGGPSIGSSTAPWTSSSSPDRMGPGEMGSSSAMHMPFSVSGLVTAVDGTTLTISGRMGIGSSTSATSTFTVDASSARIFKDATTSEVSAIAVGDHVMVGGPVSGSSVTAKVVIDGMMPMMMGHMMPGQHMASGTPRMMMGGHRMGGMGMGSSTKGNPPQPGTSAVEGNQ